MKVMVIFTTECWTGGNKALVEQTTEEIEYGSLRKFNQLVNEYKKSLKATETNIVNMASRSISSTDKVRAITFYNIVAIIH